ncbi:MAG TPA: ureidoglycolate lyase [Anaerolineae bacterium]|nr:ureidoglycolate lyase [Anaerolineae bacterium]
MIEKKTKALTRETFEPFGQLITVPQDISVEPGAVHGWSRVATAQFAGEVEVGWLKLLRRPVEITQMEHHLGTPEMIIPLDVPLLVPVAPGDGSPDSVPDPEQIEGFVVKPGQALVMDKSGWHWLPFPTEGESGSCLIIFVKDTPEHDLLIRDLPSGQSVHFIA